MNLKALCEAIESEAPGLARFLPLLRELDEYCTPTLPHSGPMLVCDLVAELLQHSAIAKVYCGEEWMWVTTVRGNHGSVYII